MNLDWYGYRLMAWTGTILTGLGAVVAAWQGKWYGVLLLAGFTIAQSAFLLRVDRPPALVNLLVVVAGLINAAGLVWDLYARLWWFDEMLHFYTPFALTLFLGVLARRFLLGGAQARQVWVVLTIASIGITLGVLWEIVEWGYDLITARNSIKGKMDTMLDLTMDSIGAVVAGWVSLWLD